MVANNSMHDDRISFQKIPFFVNLPDLLDLQKESYQKFLQEENSEETGKTNLETT